MASEAPTVTTGGKGVPSPYLNVVTSLPSRPQLPPLAPMANLCSERLAPTVSLYVPVFANDPLITYMLCSMPTQSARLAYLPDYFQTLLKAAALNSASFDTIGPDSKYEACAVLMPPGKHVDNTWTLIPAGFLGCLWRLGWGGCKVCYIFLALLVSSKIHCLSLRERRCWRFGIR